MTHASSDNLYGLPTYIVDADPAKGSHTTITLAMADASSGDIIGVRSGTYTEDFTMVAGTELVSLSYGKMATVRIVGKITISGAGSYHIHGIRLTTNSDNFIASSAGTVYVRDCDLRANDANGVAMTLAGQVWCYNCSGDVGGAFTMWTSSSSGTMNIFDSNFSNSASSTTASTNSSGTVAIINTKINHPVSSSLTGVVTLLQSSKIECGAINTTAFAATGTAQHLIDYSILDGGTATALTIGTGVTVQARDITILSSNAAAISGAGAIIYSHINYSSTSSINSVTTQTLRTNNNGPISFDGGTTIVDNNIRYQGPYFENLGIDYNGGTGVFTVQGATASLSTSNRAYIVLPSKADPGEFVRYEVTADQSFIDDAGASEIIGNLFGLTTSVAYGEDIPFFIYAVPRDDTGYLQFMISRVPHLKTSPAAANIGAPDDAVADAQGDMWSLDNINETLYDSNPCLCIGSFRMQMSASDDWTVQTLNNSDGTGQYQEGIDFTFPTGVFGAVGTFRYMLANGGAAPAFSINTFIYRILKSGDVSFEIDSNNDAGTDGSGAVSTLVTMPYIADQSIGVNTFIGFGRNIDPTNGTSIALAQASDGNNYFFVMLEGGVYVQNGDYTNGGRTLTITCSYRISK